MTWIGIVLGAFLGAAWGDATDDDSQISRYFEQLRRRGFYQVAEAHAESRLADPLLPAERRIEFVIELSRTLVAHALSAADDQQQELWEKAGAVLAEELSVAGDSPRRIVIEVYAALVPTARAEQLVWDVETAPFEEPLQESLDRVSQEALQKLAKMEQSLTERIRALEGRKKGSSGSGAGVTVVELRRLLFHLRLKMGFMKQARARLSPGGSQERHSDLIDADEHFRKLASSSSDEWQSQAKLGMAIGNRLRDELDRALEMLDNLAAESKSAAPEFLDAVRLERVRVLLASRHADHAAQELLKLRVGREHLPGDYWLTYFQTLAALRKTAAQRQATALIEELNSRAEAALQDVDRQAGGSWSRRCRALWSAAESVERYGQRIAALISRGDGEYLAGRVDSSITAFSSALELAQEDGKTELEMELGYKLAAIFATKSRWDDVSRLTRQLVAAHPQHAKSDEIDLLNLHALGMLYDHDRTPERKATYENALAKHLELFRKSPSASEVEFLRGRLWESSGSAAEAISAYQRVKPDHARGPAAIAAVARCAVALLLGQRETGARDPQLERMLLEFIAPSLKALPEPAADWTDPQIELAYHGVRVLLLTEPPRFAEAERRLNQLNEAKKAEKTGVAPTEIRTEVGRRIGPLKLIALAGQGRPHEAERLLGTVEQSSATDLLALVEELSQMEIPSPAPARRSLVEMQLASAEVLDRRRSELSAPQQRRLDLALAKSYLATTQVTNAIKIYQRLLDASPKDIELARLLGRQLLAREELGCRTLARTCWQRVEASYKQGSPEWLEARRDVIESCLRTGDKAQARKLMDVTRLLYPKLGGDELRKRYEKLDVQLK